MNKVMFNGLVSVLLPFSALGAYGGSYIRSGGYAKSTTRSAWVNEPHGMPIGDYKIPAGSTVNGEELDIAQGQDVNELIIIDSAVPDKSVFYKGLKPGVGIVEIGADDSGIDQLMAILSNHSNLSAVHVVSHALDGQVLLGNDTLSAESINDKVQLFNALNGAIREGGDLLFYGCNLARGEKGEALLELITGNTHVDVAASNNLTGTERLGGDWDLEIQRGHIDGDTLFSELALKDFSSVLAPVQYVPDNFCSSSCFIASASHTSSDGDIVFDGSLDVYAYDGGYATAGFYLDYDSSATSGHLQFSADGTNIASFELTAVNFNALPGYSCSSANVTGYLVGGGTVSDSFTLSGSGSVALTNLSGQQITKFRVNGSSCDAKVYWPLRLNNFSVDNKLSSSDSDGALTAAGGVTEPVGLDTTVDTVGEAVSVFDFNLSDGGTSDGLAMDVSQVVVNVSGTSTDAERGQVTWRLNGPDVSNVTGTYNAGSDTITFSGLSVSVADGASETYTVNAYYNDNTNITEDQTFILSVDGDTDVTVSASGTQMGATNAVTNGSGTTIDVVASQMAFTTQPSGSVSGSVLTTQPVVTARDAFGNTDVDFTETVTLTEASAGTLSSNTQASVAGVATFTGLTYIATADQQSFTLTANDQDGIGGDLPTVDANGVTSDVVASKLIFDAQPAPTMVSSGVATAFSTVPVVTAVDGNNVPDTGYSTDITLAEVNGAGSASLTVTGDTDGNGSTVTLTPGSGTATFTGLQAIYTASGSIDETFNLRASSGGLSTVDSTQLTASVTPTISSVSVPSSGTYVAGQNLDFTVNASQSITVNTAGGTPRLSLNVGGSVVYASYVSGSGTGALAFRYTLQAGDLDTDGVSVNALEANGGTLQGGSGNNLDTTLNSVGSTGSVLVDAVDPTVSSVSVPSSNSYAAGENLDFTVNASENVPVNTAGGTPRIPLTVGSTTRYASYLTGSSTSALVFRYTVQAGDEDTDGVTVSAAVDPDGGVLQDSAGNNLNTTLNSVGNTSGVLVDAVAPAGYSVSFDDSTLSASESASASFTFAAAEIGAGYSYTVSSSGGGTQVTGSGTIASATDQITGLDLSGLGDGALSLSVTLTDTAGNSGTAATDTATLDTTAPTSHSVSFDDATLNSTEAGSVSFTFAAAEVGAGYSYTISSSGGGTPVTGAGTITTATDQISGLDLSGLSDGTLTLSAVLTDATGNSATAVTDTATLDATAPGGHSVSFDQGTLNSTNVGSTSFTFASAEVGADYAYTISSAGGGAPVTGSGTIASSSGQVTGLDLSGLSDGSLTLSVTLTDAAGNNATGVTDTAELDTVAPTGHSAGFDDSQLNGSEAASASFTFSGAEVGADYSYTVSGSGGAPVTGSGTVASAVEQVGGLDLTGLDDGTVTLSVTLTDPAGNSASAVTDTATLDTTAPTSHSVSFDDATLNSTEAGSVSFTFAAAEVGAGYSYTISSSGGGTPVSGSGTIASATDQITGIDLSGLSDGTLVLSVALTDEAGNSASAVTDTATLDASAPGGHSVGFDDNLFNATEAGAASFTFESAESGADYSYTISSNGGGTPVTGTGTLTSAGEQISGIDLSGLSDGTLTLSVTLTDTVGNTAGAVSDTAVLDTSAPTGQGVSFDEADISAAEATSVSFTFSGAEVGADYSYTISSGGGGTPVTGTGTLSDGAQQITGVDVSGLGDGTLTLSVELTDEAGNASPPVTSTATLDATAAVLNLSSSAATVVNGAFSVTVDFDEAVSGFEVGDLVVSNGALSDFSGSGTSYSATVTPTEDGTVTVDVGAGAAQDQAGNETAAATQLSRVYDGTAPAPVITTDVTADVTNAPIGLTVDFGEAVTGFVSADLSVNNGSVTAFSDLGNGLFELTVEATSDGDVTIDLLAGVAEDEAGNANEASDPLVIAFDGSGPVLQGSVPAAGADDVLYLSDLALTFNEPVFAGTGELVVQDVTDGFEHTRLSVTDAQVSIDDAQVTVVLDEALVPTHEYYVTFAANSLEDDAGNSWGGITDNTAYRFTVGNQAPVADNDSGTLEQGARLALDVLANDRDEEGRLNAASVRVVTLPAHGGAYVETSTGAITYEPEAGYTGDDSFTYVVEDEFGGESNLATVSLTVEPAGLPPVTRGDTVTVSPGGTATLAPLDNDRAAASGVELDPQSAELVLRPHHGTAQWFNGELTYTAADGFEGVETLAYTVADANGVRSVVTRLFINVTDGAAAPVARDDSANTDSATEITLDVLANDDAAGGVLASDTVQLGGLPAHGVAEVDPGTGEIRYTPDEDFRGEDSFHYTVRDDRGLVSETALVTVSVGLSGAPVARNDQVRAMDGATLAINVLGNDRGLDSTLNAATLSLVDGPSKGLVTLDAGVGVFRYTPDGSFDGTDSFTYTVRDAGGQISTPATVMVTDQPGNNRPLANALMLAVAEDTNATLSPLANDQDLNGTLVPASLVVGQQPLNGTLSVAADGTLNYTPEEHFYGEDRFTYTVEDNNGLESRLAVVRLVVAPVPDKPLISGSPTSTVTAGSAYRFTPVATDIDGNPLTFSVANLPEWATFDEQNGHVSGTPELDDVSSYSGIVITVSNGDEASGLDPFSIRVTDNSGGSGQGGTGEPDSPVAPGSDENADLPVVDPDNPVVEVGNGQWPSYTEDQPAKARYETTFVDATGEKRSVSVTLDDPQAPLPVSESPDASGRQTLTFAQSDGSEQTVAIAPSGQTTLVVYRQAGDAEPVSTLTSDAVELMVTALAGGDMRSTMVVENGEDGTSDITVVQSPTDGVTVSVTAYSAEGEVLETTAVQVDIEPAAIDLNADGTVVLRGGVSSGSTTTQVEYRVSPVGLVSAVSQYSDGVGTQVSSGVNVRQGGSVGLVMADGHIALEQPYPETDAQHQVSLASNASLDYVSSGGATTNLPAGSILTIEGDQVSTGGRDLDPDGNGLKRAAEISGSVGGQPTISRLEVTDVGNGNESVVISPASDGDGFNASRSMVEGELVARVRLDGSSSHRLSGRTGKLDNQARSLIPGSLSLFFNDRVVTVSDGGEATLLTELLDNGEVRHEVATNGGSTRAFSYLSGSSTVMEPDGEGRARVVTRAPANGRSLEVTANADGSASHRLTNRLGEHSDADIQVPGAFTSLSEEGNLRTRVRLGGSDVCAWVETFGNGETGTGFGTYDPGTLTCRSVEQPTSLNSLFEAGNSVNVESDTGNHIITIETRVTRPIRF